MLSLEDIVVADNVTKVFENSKTEVLRNINLRIKKGEFCALTGPSGSGKSTLLHLLGALDVPTSGEIFINSNPLSKLSDVSLAKIRQDYIGFVFQFHFLLPEFSSLENLVIPQLLKKVPKDIAEKKAEKILEKVGLKDKKDRKPSQMSGGEQQRVSIARALVGEPSILFADEPTGNLDSTNSNNIYSLLRELNQELNQTIMVVTHDNNFAEKADRIINIIDGKIVSD